MQLDTMTLNPQEAELKYKEYLEAEKGHKAEYISELKRAYYYLRKGRKIIDIFDIFKKIPLNEDNTPKLAISRADLKNVNFQKLSNGGGRFFARQRRSRWNHNGLSFEIELPADTFKWEMENKNGWLEIKKPESMQAVVPIVPADKLPPFDLSNYFIMFEVNKWEPAPPRDPFLLKRISRNLFVIMAKWNLTKLERAVIRGKI